MEREGRGPVASELERSGQLAAMGRRGAVATAHPLATRAGMDVLRAGGNAIDAALAAGAVMNVCEPHTSHLGGDAFLLIHEGSSGRAHAINASGPAPLSARREDYREAGIPLRGHRSSTVPCQVAGWDLARKLFGTWHWGDLLQAAIGHAEWGFPVARRLAEATVAHAELLARSPLAARRLLSEGQPLRVGDTLRQPELAHVLRALAIGGSEEFARLGIASLIVEEFARNGGDLGAGDLASCAASRPEPIAVPWGGRTVYVQPPLSQAFVMLEALLLAAPHLAQAPRFDEPAWLHASIEAMKLAFADRFAYVGDEGHAASVIEGLLAPARIARHREAIDPARATRARCGPPPDSDTTQIATADEAGNAVCLIQSLFHAFGCGVMVEGGGFFVNNRLTGFSLEPESPNCLAPGKLPVHTLSTYLAAGPEGWELVGGCPGGMKQVQFNLQILGAILAFGHDPQRAVELPRWAWEDGLALTVERDMGEAAIEALRRLGHEVRPAAPFGGGGTAQVIRRRADGLLLAGSDPRADGHAEAW